MIYKKNSAKYILTFLYFLLCIGYSWGTFVLTNIVRGVVTYLRLHDVSQSKENTFVIIIIILFLATSFLFTKWLLDCFLAVRKKGKFVIVFLLTVLLAYCLWYWATPRSYLTDKPYYFSIDRRFAAGPYPDRLKILQIKEDGYSGIISLLSPLVVPIEPILIRREQESGASLGIPVINIPMLPWLSTNETDMQKIKELVAQKGNKYYVHCYYGRDRVLLFMAIVNNLLQASASNNLNLSNQQNIIQVLPKRLDKLISFTRGYGVQIDSHLVVTPLLTKEEFLWFIGTGGIKNPFNPIGVPIKTVISLNPATDTQYNTIAGDEEKILPAYGVQFFRMVLSRYPYDPLKALAIAKKIRLVSDPVLVYDRDMPPAASEVEGVIWSYLTNLPSVPDALFDMQPMDNGPVKVIAPNVVIGPTPDRNEYQNYLYPRGIRSFLYIGNCESSEAERSEFLVKSSGLQWSCTKDKDQKIYSILSGGGPWFVFGSGLKLIQSQLEDHFKNSLATVRLPIPTKITNNSL